MFLGLFCAPLGRDLSSEFGITQRRDEIYWHGRQPYVMFDICTVRHDIIFESEDDLDDAMDWFVSYFNSGFVWCGTIFTLTYGKSDEQTKDFICRQWQWRLDSLFTARSPSRKPTELEESA